MEGNRWVAYEVTEGLHKALQWGCTVDNRGFTWRVTAGLNGG